MGLNFWGGRIWLTRLLSLFFRFHGATKFVNPLAVFRILEKNEG